MNLNPSIQNAQRKYPTRVSNKALLAIQHTVEFSKNTRDTPQPNLPRSVAKGLLSLCFAFRPRHPVYHVGGSLVRTPAPLVPVCSVASGPVPRWQKLRYATPRRLSKRGVSGFAQAYPQVRGPAGDLGATIGHTPTGCTVVVVTSTFLIRACSVGISAGHAVSGCPASGCVWLRDGRR
jgi:hypothetical protein